MNGNLCNIQDSINHHFYATLPRRDHNVLFEFQSRAACLSESLDPILDLYSQQYGVQFDARLGEGKAGEVYRASRLTAVKFLSSLDYFNREPRAYKLLNEQAVTTIAGHQCPALIRTDGTLLSIEMTIVRPPFIVDFVSAYTDDELDWLGFSADVLAERYAFWEDVGTFSVVPLGGMPTQLC